MDKYNPHPAHQIFPILAIFISAGLALAFPSWQFVIAMFAVTAISLIVSWSIAVAIKVKAEEDYWYWVGESVKQLRDAQPEIWQALGFTEPPTHAKITINEIPTGKTIEDENPFYTTKYRDVPVSPALLQTFADGILSGRHKLSEGNWAGIIPGPKYRKFQDWMESENLIAKVNPDAATQGYILTEAGEQWLLQCASIAIVGIGGDQYVRKIPVRSDHEVV